jgi:hypothetical protein
MEVGEMARQPELDDDGRPTPVTTFLAVHHGLRRDAHRYAAGGDIDGLARHWTQYRAILTLHHQQEDDLLFPLLRAREPHLSSVIDRLDAEHHGLDDLLEDLDAAFAARSTDEAIVLARRLAEMLDRHLDLEEEHLVPVMAPGGDGPGKPEGDPFGGLDPAFVLPWMADGLPDDVVAALLAGLPPDLRDAFPAWQAAYDAEHWPEGVGVVH